VAKIVDSQALEPVNKALGLAGSGDSQTEITDGIVDQVLEVGPIVRRGRTLGDSQGIFRAVFRNTHAGADAQTSVWSPYITVVANAIAPFPTPMPDSFDLWLTGAGVRRQSGTGTVNAALMIQNVRQGFGVSQTGAFVASNGRVALAFWNQSVSVDSDVFLVSGGNFEWPFRKLALRIPRVSEAGTRVQIMFETSSTAASEWELNLFYGMFPVALGQDAID